jgi:serine/threonine protein kinase/tetratricopeptide (TPR) repeat protein
MALVFGKYEKIRRIAQGGMGEVFLARQTGVLDRLAILKQLRADLASEREFVDQFLDEARVAATLNHPNIVSIYDVGESNNTYYIAMEYVPGEDLSKLWYAAAKAGVGLPFQVSVRICYEAALGLDHAHKARDVRGSPLNIVHRDVSPQNIMVRGDGVVKLVDFGIAKAANKSSRTQTGMVKGKLQYMSPEQVRGEALDGRSDQFSLGVVLWEMCTGRRLFKADTEINTLQKILQAPIPKPSDHVPGFPPELETTILKMLQRDVEKRFRHLSEAANELKTYLDRAALSTGETTVAGFVQQILGKELDERVRDLTPMESTEHAAPNPLLPQNQAKQKAQAPAGTKTRPAVNDGPTQVLGPAEDPRVDDARDDIGKMSTGPRGEWAVKKQDGSLMHFQEMSTLHQWILDGQVQGEDQFSTDGRTWKKLASAAQFQKFLEIATAARSVSDKTQPAMDPATMQLGVVDYSKGGSQTGQFSLGNLPQSQTGTWGAPEIALAVAKARSQGMGEGMGASAAPTAKAADGFTPATKQMETAPPTQVTKSAARVPTVVWMLGGIVVALAAVVGVLALLDPDLLRTLVAPNEDGTEVLKALSAAKNDDPVAIDALLKTADGAAKADGASADAVAAAAVLHVARARIDDEAVRLATLLDEAKAKGPLAADPKVAETSAAESDKHRESAYRLANKALSLDKKSPGAHLAMASFHAEKDALPELNTDGDSALAAAKGTPLEQPVTSELALLKGLVEGRAALVSSDANVVRAAADKLGSVDDARAKSLVALLRAHAASMSAPGDEDKAKADSLALHGAARALAEGAAANDVRATLLTALDKAVAKELEDKPATKPANNATPAKADAGPATTAPNNNANNGANPAGADAGVAAPPPPETYETAIAKAKKAQANGAPKEAVRLAKKALELKPGSVDAQIVIGFAYIDLAAYGNALQAFAAVQKENPKSCDAQIGIATALEQQQKTEDARKAYLGYVDICPNGKDAEMAKSAAARLE